MSVVGDNGEVYKAMPTDLYYNFFEVCRWEGIPEGTAKGGVRKGLESIRSMRAVKEIGHQFQCFPKYENGLNYNQYGILKTDYDFYKKHGRAKRKSSGRPKRWKNEENISYINMPINKQLYDTFKGIVDHANSISIQQTTYRDQFYTAIKEYIERRPHLIVEEEVYDDVINDNGEIFEDN